MIWMVMVICPIDPIVRLIYPNDSIVRVINPNDPHGTRADPDVSEVVVAQDKPKWKRKGKMKS